MEKTATAQTRLVNFLNKKILMLGLFLMGMSLFIPHLVPFVLEGIFHKQASSYHEAVEIILSHSRLLGLGLGCFIVLGSFFYFYPPYRRFFRESVPKVALLVGSTLLTLFVIEAVLHLKYKDIQVGGMTSPSHFTFYKKYYHHNKFGFRDREREHSNKENHYRILALGDSFTYGAGVRFIEDLYPYRLEEKLNQVFSEEDRKFEVINTGLRGLNTAQEFKYLKTKGMLFKPDFLVLGFTLNDAETPKMKREAAEEAMDWQLLPYPYGIILNKYSFSYFFLRNRIEQVVNQWNNPNQKRIPFLEKLYGEDNLIAYRKVFDAFMEYCRKQDLKVLVVLFPKMSHVCDEEYPYRDVHAFIKEIVLSNEMVFIDLLDPLRNSDIKNLTVSKTDSHPSKEVHHFVAESIYNKLIKEDLL